MGIFGWDLPPGCSINDIDPPEGPCECCGQNLDDCNCPDCPVCHGVGNPLCYRPAPLGHGLVYSQVQLDGQAALKAMYEEIAAEQV